MDRYREWGGLRALSRLGPTAAVGLVAGLSG